MRKLSLLLIPVLLFVLCSCPINKDVTKQQSLTVVSWNVQNIFNGIKDGYEYDEYLPSSGWNEEAYSARLSRLAAVVSYKPLSDADVFIFNEIENDSVAEDILNLKFFKKNNFCHYATAGSQNGAIKTAVLSRIPIINVTTHTTKGRPVLQVELQNLNEHVFILAIHAKSNIEGENETAPIRLSQAQVIDATAKEIHSHYPDALIMIAGDFNETYNEKNMMCDSRSCFANCPLKLLPDFKDGFWYCPWLDTYNTLPVNGSYFYNNEWLCYDNILVSSQGHDFNGWEYKDGGVVFQGILQTTDNKPNAFRRDLLTGVSDHLPIWVSFERYQSLSPT